MKNNRFTFIGLILLNILLVVSFQNCSTEMSSMEEERALSLSSIYPYTSKPDYFEDVQIIKKELEGATWKYQFVAVVVHVDQEDEMVDAEVLIQDSQGNLICPRHSAKVKRGNNHMVIDCESSHDFEFLKALVRAGLEGESIEDLRTIDFDLSDI